MSQGPGRSVAEVVAGQTEHEQGPGEAERPAGDDVARPVHAQGDAAGADRDGEPGGGPQGDGAAREGGGEEEGEGEVDDRRIGGVAAREGEALDLDEVGVGFGADAGDFELLDFDQGAAAQGDGEEGDGGAEAALPAQPERAGGSQRPEDFEAAEHRQDVGGAGDARVGAGIEDGRQRAVELEAAEQQHHQPGDGQPDEHQRHQSAALDGGFVILVFLVNRGGPIAGLKSREAGAWQ